MNFAFDLISDLHIETWPTFDWEGQATSQMCVVAGDVSRDHEVLRSTLTHLSKCYQGVLYIDGNDEYKDHWDNITTVTQDIHHIIDSIPGVVYLQDNVVIANDTAFLATNGWWDWNFDTSIELDQSYNWFTDKYKCGRHVPHVIQGLAENDFRYLYSSVGKLQTHVDVKNIVIVTHTVPSLELINHDTSLEGTYRVNTMGNSMMRQILNADTQGKIKTWCMGHYHSSIDRVWDGVRYVNNCRGRGDTDWRQSAYYPRRIEVS